MTLIASGKTVSGFDMIKKIAVGADMVNAARTMLFAVGCIQALRCDTNICPSGIATQDPQRNLAVDVALRQQHVANYHRATIRGFLDLVGAMGLASQPAWAGAPSAPPRRPARRALSRTLPVAQAAPASRQQAAQSLGGRLERSQRGYFLSVLHAKMSKDNGFG